MLGKFFIKIIELRKSVQDSDEMRCHFELQASEHEKQLEDAQHFISVMQERREREYIELQRRHEEEVQFLKTLSRGRRLFNRAAEKATDDKMSGEHRFLLA